ncbi:hypothetical protein P691DRAFT_802239 [Macrolepiota fuliginosa MF-IS2]|uniref:Uncharacterized protein n=1 Tax=Macrolepiota fuliginosa MF-IS2 TaxID=1400762 RepID=A0A9P6BUP6_9AGAR|nr:hypothetical protein P691DRAFT_802239 [Macrolepiota fuliginosa MF-IS2]
MPSYRKSKKSAFSPLSLSSLSPSASSHTSLIHSFPSTGLWILSPKPLADAAVLAHITSSTPSAFPQPPNVH